MIPNHAKQILSKADIDWENDTIKVMLLKDTTSYSPDQDNHEFVSDITSAADEMDDTNYSRQTLSSNSSAQDDSDDEAELDADDITFSNLGGSQTVQTIVIYKQVGGDDSTEGDDPVLRVIDDSESSALPIDTNGNDLDINWSSEGILNIS